MRASLDMSDRSRLPTENGFSGRAARTLRNSVESAVMFVPVTVGLLLLHGTSRLTSHMALAYVIARVLFIFSYWFGLNKARSAAWTVGMACITVLLVKLAIRIQL